MAFILDKVDDIKEIFSQNPRFKIKIIQSAFIEMFGDPIINPHNYPIIRFGELGTLDEVSQNIGHEMIEVIGW